MALRRKLPSRMTPDTPSESEATPKVSLQPAAKAAPSQPAVVEIPEPVAPQADPFAAAAAEAFGTVPEAAPKPRVLEESFSAPVVAELAPEPVADTFVAPAWQEPAAEANTFTAPAWDAPAETPAQIPVEVPMVGAQPEPQFTAPAWGAPAAEPVVAAPEFVAPAWEQPAVAAEPVVETVAPAVTDFMPAATETVTAPSDTANELPQAVGLEPTSQPAADEPEGSGEVVEGPTNFSFEPSRPDGSRIKRRVREKRARDFSAMGASDDAKPAQQKPVTDAFAPNVPVDTRPIDQVDNALIESGVMAPRPGDSLTSHLPGSVAESTTRFEPEPQFTPQPVDVSQPEPQPVAEAAPELPTFEPVREPEPVPQPELLNAVPQAPAAEPEPYQPRMPEFQPFVPPAPQPEPEPDVAAPSFTLSNAPSVASEAPMPAPQSDLPWVQSQSAAEWDIGPAAGHDWAQHSPETASEPAMHMPPQADLYKPLPGRSSSVPPQIPGSMPLPSASGRLTPELPGQRRKAQGTPWALVAVGAVVVLAAGAYLLTSGKQGAGAQLANLSNRSATGNDQQPLLPPPAGSGSFMTADTAPVTASGTALLNDPSSSAMVNFADVPPDMANQPIVADGNEEMPKGFIAQFQNEVEKARTLKEGGAPNAAVASVTPSATTPEAGTGYTQDDLKKELDAYRNALASSANPAELKPGSFNTGGATQGEGDMASGSLLPPPNALPPAELYTNNPNNLPVVAEPVTNAPDRVRTLADFPEVEAYMPEREKVAIPANLKPKLAATDFPALEVLSFVPNQGVVAFADGREGVLLIGESINGWELVAVNADTAEFKTGQKSYQVTNQN